MYNIFSMYTLVYTIIIFIDPCEFKPCQNNGECTSYKDRSGFTCFCGIKHEGTLCEKGKSDTL